MIGRKTLLAASVMAATSPVMASQNTDLHHIMSMQSNPSKVAESATSGVKQVRSKAVYQAAETYSSQVAYCHQTHVLAKLVNKEKAHLNQAYNFANLLLDGGRVLPPVIQQDDASYRQQGNNKAVTAQTDLAYPQTRQNRLCGP